METCLPVSGLVLAAGRGTRMRTDLPKALVSLGGRPMVLRLLDTLAQAGIQDLTVVVGYAADLVRGALPYGVGAVAQADLGGTAQAVSLTGPVLRSRVAPPSQIVVTTGDTPLLRPESVRRLVETHLASQAACTFLCAVFDEPVPHPRVVRNRARRVTGFVEDTDAPTRQRRRRERLTSHFAFEAEALWSVVDRVPARGPAGERTLNDAVGLLLAAGQRVESVRVDDPRELVGVNTPEDLAWAEGILAEREPSGT
ncbi:MAG: NTP transferase domain-containing protein [Deltaproteobacteria bacterium]|nr:NTP transferase domain-containing protein [Deltaproteobacteria bacterium]